jgi:hypothetical protein
MLIAGVGMLIGGIVTLPGLAFNSEPGSSKSISLGDWPEKLGLVLLFGGAEFVSSNKLLKLFVTVSASNLPVGLGNSRRYGGVLISNMGGWSNWMSGRGGNEGGVGAAAWKKDSCMEISSASAPGVEEEASDVGEGAGRSGGFCNSMESEFISICKNI